jgi:hypothetical protein
MQHYQTYVNIQLHGFIGDDDSQEHPVNNKEVSTEKHTLTALV